jgi:hypothetical protein
VNARKVNARPRDDLGASTEGRVWVKGCRSDYAGSTSGVPDIADDLSHRAGRQPWANFGLVRRKSAGRPERAGYLLQFSCTMAA